MTLSDSILLQISQKKTSYNDLLTRTLPNYSSKSSAKAALSRALKNLIAFGNIKKENNFYEITNKGENNIKSKIKNKILININELIIKNKKTKDLRYLNDIIKSLQIFIERSKYDPVLLKIGKTSSGFYVSDIKDILLNLNETIKHYNYLNKVLEKQILILQEHNFEDRKTLNLDKKGISKLLDLCEFYNLEEFIVEFNDDDLNIINIFKDNFNFKLKSSNTFVISISNIDDFKKIIFDNLELIINTKFKMFINEIIIKVVGTKMCFIGPHNIISDIK
jgi:hypothetical protein